VVSNEIPDAVVSFVMQNIDRVAHLEALLLLWQDSELTWSREQIAARLYVGTDAAAQIIGGLQAHGLVRSEGEPPRYRYAGEWDASGEVMRAVAHAYRHQLVQMTALIHSRAPSSVRAFARAFDLKKDR
jgi:hypothetical protein